MLGDVAAVAAERDAEAVARGLRDLGVGAGGTILVHASVRALGPVAGGLETVVDGLLRAVGPTGTLLMPALSWSLRPPAVFDPTGTPSIVGALAEHFRRRPGTRRSVHPTHSVSAVGRRARELLAAHVFDRTPCGPQSPFRRLLETEGTIVLLGCGLAPNTTMHALEELAQVPYLFGPDVTFTLRDRRGRERHARYRTHGFDEHGCTQRYDRVLTLDTGGFLARGRVLGADAYVLDAPALGDAVVARLRDDPWAFVDRAIETDAGPERDAAPRGPRGGSS